MYQWSDGDKTDYPEVQFMTARGGRIYTAEKVRPVVISLVRRRWPKAMLKEGWTKRCNRYLRDPAWLRRHNGEVPASLARALEWVALGDEFEAD